MSRTPRPLVPRNTDLTNALTKAREKPLIFWRSRERLTRRSQVAFLVNQATGGHKRPLTLPKITALSEDDE